MPRSRWLFLLLSLSLVGCTGNPSKTNPVVAEKPKPESELVYTTISAKAVAKLDIRTQPAARKEVHEHLPMTGWIMAKPGHEVTLTAPTAGFVRFGKDLRVPIAGENVKPGQELLQIDPVLSPVELIQVASLKRSIESDLAKAETTRKTAESEFERIRDLYKQNIRSKQEFEQAQKALDHAKEEVAAAKDKLKVFQTPTVPLKAPRGGTILQLFAGPGQYVPLAAPLVTIIDLRPVWIRVPIQENDLPLVDPKQNITWNNPNQEASKKPEFLAAKPTGRVAQVDPNKHTADLWYELDASQDTGRFVKDQMLTVQVPIGRKQQATVVPYSAIVFDAYSHTWIYLDRGPDKAGKQQYERRRVEMVTAVDDSVVIRPAPADGELVVTHGAAALFSREFHKAPVQVPGEDD